MNQPARPDPVLSVLARPPSGSEGSYRLFVPLSLVLAVLLGFALGLHVAASRLTGGGDPVRTTEFIHAHGQVQLLGFAGLYIMAMSFRLLPRFSGGSIAWPRLIPVIAVLIAASLVLRAVVQPFLSGRAWEIAALLGACWVLLAAVIYGSIALMTVAGSKRPSDASVFAFLAGSGFLVLSSFIAALFAVRGLGGGPTPSSLETQALLHLQMFGFVLSFIAGVMVRAVPTMVGVERPSDTGVKLLLGIHATAVVLVAAWLLSAGSGGTDGMSRAAALAYFVSGLALVGVAVSSGALTSWRSRLRPASQPHLWLVRSAAFWLLIAGTLAVKAGMTGLLEGQIPAQLEMDAVRHTLGIGVVTMLIVGMSLLIVPEFAAQRQWQGQHRLAVILVVCLNLAVLLRVMPSSAATWFSNDARNLMMTAAGSLAEIALIVFAVSLLRLIRPWARS